MPTYIALLRGVNVGGKNKLPMQELRAALLGGGFSDVATYIQSGNVVLQSDSQKPEAVAPAISAVIKTRFGFEVPATVRSAEQLRAVIENNPFLARGCNPKALHVAFLAHRPDPDAVKRLDPERSPPDEFIVHGDEIYLHCPNGLARSKLTNAWFDSQLGTISTVRNWNTVRRLFAMAGG